MYAFVSGGFRVVETASTHAVQAQVRAPSPMPVFVNVTWWFGPVCMRVFRRIVRVATSWSGGSLRIATI